MRLRLPANPDAKLAVPPGAAPARVHATASADQLVRCLDSQKIRAKLDQVGPPAEQTCLQCILDASGSMNGGNDILGLRHEGLLIALEHLVDCAGGRKTGWSAELRSFDLDSTLDTPCLPARRRSLKTWRQALLRPPAGGISSLAAALADAEQGHPDTRRVLIIFSDFELFDPPDTLQQLAASNAHHVIACVFRSPVPPILEAAPTVDTFHIDPATTTPSDLCIQLTNKLSTL